MGARSGWTRAMHGGGRGSFLGLGAVPRFLGPGQTLLWQWRSAAAFPSLVQDQLPTVPSSALRPGMLNQHKVN